MIIKDLKDVHGYPKLYQRALQRNAGCSITLGSAFTWGHSPEGHEFWNLVDSGQFDKAQSEHPHLKHLFEQETEFKEGDIVEAICDSRFGIYKKGDRFTFLRWFGRENFEVAENNKHCLVAANFRLAKRAEGKDIFFAEPANKESKDEYQFIEYGARIRVAESDNHNQSAINDGLPPDYIPPTPRPRTVSFLDNDYQREQAELIDIARKGVRHK